MVADAACGGPDDVMASFLLLCVGVRLAAATGVIVEVRPEPVKDAMGESRTGSGIGILGGVFAGPCPAKVVYSSRIGKY
jgi:hypothetical protein